MPARRLSLIYVMSLTQDLPCQPDVCLSSVPRQQKCHSQLINHIFFLSKNHQSHVSQLPTTCLVDATNYWHTSLIRLFCIHTRCHHTPSIDTSCLVQLFSIRIEMPLITNTIQFNSSEHHNKTIHKCFEICIAHFFKLVISFIQDLTNSRFHLKVEGGVRDILAHNVQT